MRYNYSVKFSKLFSAFLFFILMSFSFSNIYANNIAVSNVKLSGQNTTAGINNANNYTFVQFDLSWDNSWRTSSGSTNNWDAAWVFIKYRIAGGPWQHAKLNATGNSKGTGTTIPSIQVGLLDENLPFNNTTNPALGAFFYRSAVAAGSTFTITNAKLRWNYGANGVLDRDKIDIKVFAIEMTYIPTGNFFLGDGTTNTISGQFHAAGNSITPFEVFNENQIILGGVNSLNLANNNNVGMSSSDDFNNSVTKLLPLTFPKGYAGYYCMKYEITQQQWIDFFNSLTNIQKSTRDITSSSGKNSDALVFRNNISWTSGDASLPGNLYGSVACNYLSWMDGAAYADWTGLRPMTELEYEKACRGTLTPISDELASSTTTIKEAKNITNSGTNTESPSGSPAEFITNSNNNVQGPMRVGSVITDITRIKAGAGYFGTLELSGNLWERSVSISNTAGRAFTGIHGNGSLSVNGNADVPNWPGIVSSEVTTATGSGLRGGAWNTIILTLLRVSDRFNTNVADATRNNAYGFRAVRALPSSAVE